MLFDNDDTPLRSSHNNDGIDDRLFRSPFSALIVGPSNCGKTRLILEIIANNKLCLTDKIFVFYQNWQPLYNHFPTERTRFYKYWIGDKTSVVSHHHHDPSSGERDESMALENFIRKISNDGTIAPGGISIVFDDGLPFCKLPLFEEVFTRMTHHYNLNVFLTVQNLFEPSLRVIARNVQYLLLFRTPRDSAQIRHLAFQMYPEKREAHAFIATVKDITKVPFTPVLLDFKSETPDYMRVKSNLFDLDGVTIHCMKDSIPPLEYLNEAEEEEEER